MKTIGQSSRIFQRMNLVDLQSEMFVSSENDDLDQGHDDQLERRRDAEDGAERNQNGGRGEIGVQQTDASIKSS